MHTRSPDRRLAGRARSRPRRSRLSFAVSREAILFWSVLLAVATWFLFGGDPPVRPLSFALLALSGTLVLAAAIAAGGLAQLMRMPLAVKVLTAAVLLLPVVQLVPLPADLWTTLPGRRLPADVLQAFTDSLQPRPISLTVLDTWQSGLICLWLVGLAMAVALIPAERLGTVYRLLFGLALLNILVGLVQVSTGGTALSPYRSSHQGLLLGLFANKNHSGLFIACAFLTGYAGFGGVGGRDRRRFPLAVAAPISLTILAALLATNSRAGLLFGIIALGFVSLLAWERRVSQRTRTLALVALALVGVGAVFASTDVALRSFGRFASVGSDDRWDMWLHSWTLVSTYWPVGAGIGSLPTVFTVAEPLGWVGPTYVNHAHNDYLEQLVELGALAPLLWAVALLAVVPATRTAWRERRRSEGGIALVAAVICCIVLVHSSFDYPLRRPGTAMLFAVALGTLFRLPRSPVVAPPR